MVLAMLFHFQPSFVGSHVRLQQSYQAVLSGMASDPDLLVSQSVELPIHEYFPLHRNTLLVKGRNK